MNPGSWELAPCARDAVATLHDELGIDEITASVLVRRGYADTELARSFLNAELPHHDPFLLGDMRQAVGALRAAIDAGKRIVVHGDYDADGICATALAVLMLRELGVDAAWHLPSRFDEGYGLNAQTLTRLAEEGFDLVLTVDCGITGVDEVAHAKALGLDVIVTDHHRPGDAWPDCPVVATLKGDYPFQGLCGTAVVWKLATALLGDEHPFVDRHLDLVALATVADVVPLLDENRALARLGLRRLAQTQKVGLRALMRVANVDPATVDETSIGFRLAPRINASGRLCRPEAALALLLTEDPREAATVATELETLNRERQAIEERILREAVAQVEEWPEARRRQRGYVVAGEDWHEGVIGIVASRLVEKYNRPVVMLAGADGAWKGSGRSIASFDLHGALAACSSHLERFGGHRAAAGLSIVADEVDPFARAFGQYADSVLAEDDLQPQTRVDAIAPGAKLNLQLAAELAQLAPFGLGNPGVILLVDDCELADLNTVGDGKHLRFRVRQHGRDSGQAIAFGFGAQFDRFRREQRYDVAVRLQENHWNGVVSPQLVVRRIFDAADGYDELRAWLADQWRAGEDAWTPEARAIFSELELRAGDRRSLLESPTFRMLLDEKPALRQAA
ncbi:MAG TPA: single-stranded-DNA-specific exonuclease RecJ [Gaiellaceae bacterium]|nr:single-stranded-DNA-specific exonuclease RecJ [Gaiellaceae bacterium]